MFYPDNKIIMGDRIVLGDHKGRPYDFQNAVEMVGRDNVFM